MTYPGLALNNNLSEIGSTKSAWDNLGDGVNYEYGAVRANYVDNSAVPWNGERSNVLVTQASGVDLSYGNQYVYKITEQAGVAIPFNYGWLRMAITSTSYTNPEYRLNVPNGPIVGSVLLRAGSHYSVGMALRPAFGGSFFKETNYPIVSINLNTGEYRDAFSNKKTYEIMGAAEEEDGWWRVSMSSICQQAYAVAAIDLFFFRANSFNVIDPASSTNGSKFFYAALAQIEPGHEPSPIIITVNDQPLNRTTIAQSLGSISFTGNDISTLSQLASVGNDNVARVALVTKPVQPRLTALIASGEQIVSSGLTLLSTTNPTSSGVYRLQSLVASGYYVGPNAIGTVSGSPFSGNTAIVPLYLSAFTPQSWKTQSPMVSGSLTAPSLAIPIEYNDFYVTMVVGQS